MELLSRNIKTIGIGIALLLVVVWIIIFAIANRTYSASDVLGDHADLNAENPVVDIERIDLGTEDIFTSIEIPEEAQQRLITAFKTAKFKRVTAGSIDHDYDYRVNITFNTGYAMWVDSDKTLLSVIDMPEYYIIENDSDFFEILKIATE